MASAVRRDALFQSGAECGGTAIIGRFGGFSDCVASHFVVLKDGGKLIRDRSQAVFGLAIDRRHVRPGIQLLSYPAAAGGVGGDVARLVGSLRDDSGFGAGIPVVLTVPGLDTLRNSSGAGTRDRTPRPVLSGGRISDVSADAQKPVGSTAGASHGAGSGRRQRQPS